MPTVQVESYDEVINELRPLLEKHWEEIAIYKDVPLDPEFEFFKKGSEAGNVVGYTVRTVNDRRLIGYAVYFVRSGHHHYRQTGWAVSDLVFVVPEYRGMKLGSMLFDFIEKDLKQRGVKVMHTVTKVAHPELSALLYRRGHRQIEEGYSYRL